MSYNLSFYASVKGSEEVQTKLKAMAVSMQTLDKASTTSASNLGKITPALSSLNKEVTSGTSNLNKFQQGVQQLGTSSGTAQSGVSRLSSAFQGFGPALNSASTGMQSFSSRVQAAQATLTSAASGVERVGGAITSANGAFTAGAAGVQRYATTLTSAGTASNSIVSGTTRAAQAMTALSSSSSSAGQSVGRTTQEYTALGGRLGGVALSAIIMTSAFDEAVGMQEALNIASAKTQKAQEDYNAAVKAFGPTSNEAERALQRLEKAQNAEQFAARNSGFAWRDMIPIGGLLATQAIEPLIKGFTKLNELMKAGALTSTFTGGIGKLGGAATGLGGLLASLGGVSGAFQKGTPAVTGFTGALTSMNTAGTAGASALTSFGGVIGGLAGPLAIALASINTILLAMKDMEVVSAAASGKMVEAAQKAKEAWDLSKWSGTADVLGKIFGVEEDMNKVIERTKEVENGIKLARGEYEKFGDTIFVTTGRLGESAQGAQLAKGQYEMLKDGVVLVKGGMEQLTGATDKGIPASQQLAEAHKQLELEEQELGKTIMNNLLPGITAMIPPMGEWAVSAKASAEASTGLGTAAEAAGGVITTFDAALKASRQSLIDDTREKELNAETTRALIGSTQETANIIATLDEAYAGSQASISQLNTELTNSEAIFLRHNTAVNQGHVQFLEWIKTSQDAATTAATFKADLEGMANTFGGLPGFMEGTVEEYQAFIDANRFGGEAVEEFERMALESWRSLVSEAEPLFNDLKAGWEDVFSGESAGKVKQSMADINLQLTNDINRINKEMEKLFSAEEFDTEGYNQLTHEMADVWDQAMVDMSAATTDELMDPVFAAFDKLPPQVSATLDEAERGALAFQAKFAQISEMAGTTFATNLQAGVAQGLSFDDALRSANQAVADMLAPFAAEHPEMAAMFQPLFDAMNQTGPGAAQAVQDVLQQMSGIPGPVGDVAKSMLTNYQTEFGSKIPGVTKTGVEGAIQELGGIQTGLASKMELAIQQLQRVVFEAGKKISKSITEAINSKEIKQDPANVPTITVNTNPANTQIQLIGQSLTQLKDFLAQEENKITLVASNTNPLVGQITLATGAPAQVNDNLTTNTITMVGSNTNPLAGQITLTVGAPAQVNQNLTENPITMVGANINPLEAQVTLAVGMPAQVNQNLSQNTITMVGANTNPLEGQINLATAAPGQVNQNLQQNPITMVGAQTNPLEGQINAAITAHQQLQQYLNTHPITMSGGGGGGYGGGMNPGGFNPGYVSPYGSYQGAYGAPYAKGFGPAIVNRPTRMLVGEAGPEMVSVIPMKGKHWLPTTTAATGMGDQGLQHYTFGQNYGYNGPELWQSDAEEEAYKRQVQASMQQGAQQGSQRGTEQGFDQGMGGMQQAVQQGAQQGVEQGMQQGGGGGGGYPEAPSRIAAALQAGNMAEAMAGFGSGYTFNWSGGAQGQTLGMGGGGGGAQYPTAPSRIASALQSGNMAEAMAGFGTGYTFNWTGGKMGQQLGMATANGFEDGLNTNRIGGQIGQAAVRGLGTSLTVTGGLKPGQSGGTPSGQFPGTGGGGGQAFPGVYSGQVPASYGKPLGQLINGIKATILPGQGPIRQAATGMHERLRKDTLIQAHKNERVDIGADNDHPGRSSGLDNAAMGRITQLLERLLSQGSNFKVDFNVDGRKLSSVAAKNMGTAGYGDR